LTLEQKKALLKGCTEVDELKESLEFICSKSDLDFEHWYKQTKETKYLDIAFKKIAKAWRGLD
jgi:hypothetical protein